jgi:hypothetical protein
MFPTRSNRAAPERCLLFPIPIGAFWKLCHSKVYVRHPEGLRPRTRVEGRTPRSRGTLETVLPPAKARPDVEERPFRAASKSYEAGLQPRRESFQNVVATVNRKVFSGSFNTYVGPYNASACPKVKSPAAPAGNISRVIGVGAIVEVFSRNGL